MRRVASSAAVLGAAALLGGCGGVTFGRPTATPGGGLLPVPGPTATQVAVGGPQPPRLYPFAAQLKRPPPAPREESYNWLASVQSARTRRWITAENHFSTRQLRAIAQRAWIERRLEHLARAPAARGTGSFTTERIFYLTPAGERLPMLISYRRDLARDGDRPAILTVLRPRHGGSTAALGPRARVWMELGGVYAEAQVPGEAQFEEAPRGVATLSVRSEALRDLIAAARYLFDRGYTRRGRLAIYGRGYGGLLAGALLTEFPRYFAVALPTGSWAQYRHPKSSVCYPPTLIATARHDGIARPWRGYELAAALQSAQACSAQPVLIRIYDQPIEPRAAAAARLEGEADALAFAARWLGVPAPPEARGGG